MNAARAAAFAALLFLAGCGDDDAATVSETTAVDEFDPVAYTAEINERLAAAETEEEAAEILEEAVAKMQQEGYLPAVRSGETEAVEFEDDSRFECEGDCGLSDDWWQTEQQVYDFPDNSPWPNAGSGLNQ